MKTESKKKRKREKKLKRRKKREGEKEETQQILSQMRLAAFDGPSTKTPLQAQKSRKNFLTQAELQPILFQISLPWQRGSVGKNAVRSIRWHIPENLPIGAKISQKSFTQAMLQPFLSRISLLWQRESVGEKCNWQHSMAYSRKPSYRRKNFAKISYANRIIANFVSNFVAMTIREGPG